MCQNKPYDLLYDVKKEMKDQKMTINQAYLAMYSFLHRYYEITKSDDIGSLLGSMSFLNDGRLADPAFEKDWIDAVKLALNDKVDASLKIAKD